MGVDTGADEVVDAVAPRSCAHAVTEFVRGFNNRAGVAYKQMQCAACGKISTVQSDGCERG